MQNTEIIYSAMQEKTVKDIQDVENCRCFICGKTISRGVSVKAVLSGNFTNYDLCKGLGSPYICVECAACIKNADLRRNNFIADRNNLYLLKKNELEEYLFNLGKYVKGEFVVGITTSFKKHNSFRCRVNSNPDSFYIRQEDNEYLFNAEELKKVYEMMNDAYLYVPKDEIETGNYRLISLEQLGIEKYERYEREFRKYRGSNQFALMIYILNSERRNEIVKERLDREKAEKKANKKNKNGGTQQICMF